MINCLNDSVAMINTYQLLKTTCGNSACIFMDLNKTIVLKQIKSDYYSYMTLQREACILQHLSQFSWIPKLFCQKGDYLLTSYKGEAVCKKNIPFNYTNQVNQIVSDMKLVNVRHNDMSKPYTNDFVVLNNRVSLVDFSWGTIKDKLETKCILNGIHLFAPNDRPHNRNIDNGFKNPDETRHTIPPCKLKFQQPHRYGSQSENPGVIFNREITYVSGYQRFDINSDGSFIFKTHVKKYRYIEKLIKNLFNLGLTSFSDIGSNTGLVSLIAARTGFSHIDSFDHDKPAIMVLEKIKTKLKIESIHTHHNVFGTTPLPKSDIVFCGALIHWIFCLTSIFKGDFHEILQYLFSSVHKYLIIEWVAPSDGAIVAFKHTTRCHKTTQEYTTSNFETAVRSFGKIETMWEYTHSRIIYVIKNINI